MMESTLNHPHQRVDNSWQPRGAQEFFHFGASWEVIPTPGGERVAATQQSLSVRSSLSLTTK